MPSLASNKFIPSVVVIVNIVTILAISNALNMWFFAQPVSELNPRCAVAMFVALTVSLIISDLSLDLQG